MIRLLTFAFILLLYTSCQDNDFVSNQDENLVGELSSSSEVAASSSDKTESSSAVIEYLPLNDSEYPYAGIPRVVIETEKKREIKDRETEILAKMQIWGERAPQSQIIELTIKGRGNSTWDYPKKPYTISITSKQSILGMPAATKWVLLANYRDRTLMRNAISFDISQKLGLEWTPSGRFVELYVNNRFLGNYYLCEKINGSKNRLNLGKNDFLLEVDGYYDSKNKFRTKLKDVPVNIKDPDQPREEQFDFIESYLDSLECVLYDTCTTDYADLIDVNSFVTFFLTFELSNNSELKSRRSVFLHKRAGEKLNAGPVWDFDWATYKPNVKGFVNQEAFWYSKLLYSGSFPNELKKVWREKYSDLQNVVYFIDSLATYTKKSNDQNMKRWKKIDIIEGRVGDEDLSFDEAISMLKTNYKARLTHLDSVIKNR